MDTQLIRWLRATGAVLAGMAVVTAVPLWADWRGGTAHLLGWAVGDSLGCLAVLALAVLISDRFLGGRRRLVIGAALTVAGLFATEWIAFSGPEEGTMGLLFGVYDLGTTIILPLVAGAWTLRSAAPEPVRSADPLPFEGVWESVQGVLILESDDVFTLTRAGGETVAGVWELDADGPATIGLRVVAPTALGQGWQTTLLDVESGPDGRPLLRLDQDTAYTRRSEATEVEYAGGYTGQLEVLEG